MRDKWFSRMGAYRMPLSARGLLATIYDSGDIISAPFEDLDAVLGTGWLPIAQDLARVGAIKLDSPEFGWYTLEMNYPDAAYRISNRKKRGDKHAKADR